MNSLGKHLLNKAQTTRLTPDHSLLKSQTITMKKKNKLAMNNINAEMMIENNDFDQLGVPNDTFS